MNPRAEELISSLKLSPHPEGGYYREVFRSRKRVSHPDAGEVRPALTGIYFLLADGQVSRWHRCLSDEIWHYHEGSPLELRTAGPGLERIERRLLGPPGRGGEPILAIEAGLWLTARSTEDYTLTGCAVGPGFEFRDLEFLSDFPKEAARLAELHPETAQFI